MTDITNEQLKAWAADKLKNEVHGVDDDGNRVVDLLKTSVLNICLHTNSYGYYFAEVNNFYEAAMYAEAYSNENFYDALRIAYFCRGIGEAEHDD